MWTVYRYIQLKKDDYSIGNMKDIKTINKLLLELSRSPQSKVLTIFATRRVVIIHVIWTKKVVPIFCLIVRLIVRLFVRLIVRVITYGHKNEKCENKYTIWLKLYTFKVHPKLLIANFRKIRKNFFYGNLFQLLLSKSGVFD